MRRKQVAIATSPQHQPTDMKSAKRGLDFSDKDPKVCLLFMSTKMCEKMLATCRSPSCLRVEKLAFRISCRKLSIGTQLRRTAWISGRTRPKLLF